MYVNIDAPVLTRNSLTNSLYSDSLEHVEALQAAGMEDANSYRLVIRALEDAARELRTRGEGFNGQL